MPVIAIAVVALTVGATIAVAGDTFGYDFRAYHAAAVRVLEGQPLYDLDYDVAGPYGLFLYPPTFVPLILPFGLLATVPATWAWTVAMLMCFVGAVALMPVATRTRWVVVLLAGLSWPFVYNIKLGQVGPLLLLLFAIGWRGLDRALPVGIAGGAGAAIKLQPAIVLVWALLTRRWTAAIVGAGVLAVPRRRRHDHRRLRRLVGLRDAHHPGERPDHHAPQLHAGRRRLPAGCAARRRRGDPVGIDAAALTHLRADGAPIEVRVLIHGRRDRQPTRLARPVGSLRDRRCCSPWPGCSTAAIGGQWCSSLSRPCCWWTLLPAWIYPAVFWACLLAVVAIGIRGPPQCVVVPLSRSRPADGHPCHSAPDP